VDRLLILGGTGFVGRTLCALLSSAHPGLAIVVPTRRAQRARPLLPMPGVQPVQADVHDEAALRALLAGTDAVVNLVAILHGDAAAFERAHVKLPQTLARAMRAAGVSRLVHVSALGVAADAPSLYLRSKAAGEACLLQAGLACTVLRPSVIFGAGDRLLNLFARLQAVAPVLPLAARGARFQPVWVRDVAAAIVKALEEPATAGSVYECAGPEVMTLGELVARAGRHAGCERPQIGLPGWAAWAQALAMEWLPGEPLMSRDNLRSMRVPNVATGKLAGLAELGITAAALDAVAPQVLGPSPLIARRAGNG
jgi:NADH dehydrogenase